MDFRGRPYGLFIGGSSILQEAIPELSYFSNNRKVFVAFLLLLVAW
jgi:hypothetical protein